LRFTPFDVLCLVRQNRLSYHHHINRKVTLYKLGCTHRRASRQRYWGLGIVSTARRFLSAVEDFVFGSGSEFPIEGLGFGAELLRVWGLGLGA
jgi:hypothetical protein